MQRGRFIALGVSILIVLATSSSLRADFLGRVPDASPPEYVSIAILDKQADHKRDVTKKVDVKEDEQDDASKKGGAEDDYDEVDRKVMMIRVLEPVIYFANASSIDEMVRRKIRDFEERYVATHAESDGKVDADGSSDQLDMLDRKDRSCGDGCAKLME